MSEIESVKALIEDYKNVNLNESDTRLKIIDTLLIDVLKWPKQEIQTEKYINGNRADYVLKGKNQKPLFIIESKKTDFYFDLPQNINSANLYQKISIEKLLTDTNIKEAILQVKEYAEDLICKYAAICNGSTWIIFKLLSSVKPWKQLPAFVIRDTSFFLNDFTYANNILGYDNIINKNSLHNNIGVSKKSFKEIFYPKSSITAYDTVVDNNKFAGSLKSLSNKFLGQIPEADNDFMKKCYVTNIMYPVRRTGNVNN